MALVAAHDWESRHARHLVDVIVGVPSQHAARFLSRYIETSDWQGERLVRQYEHLARYIPSDDLAGLVVSIRRTVESDVDRQYIAFKGIQRGMARRGVRESLDMKTWGTAVAASLLKKYPGEKKVDDREVLAKQRFAAELAGRYRITDLQPELLAFVEGETEDVELKVSSLRALLTFDTGQYAPLAGRLLEGDASSQLKNRVAALLGDFSGPAVNNVLARVRDAPPDLQAAIVMSLAATPEGKDIIFRKVKNGELLPRTLVQPRVEERILQKISPQQRKEYQTITAKLEPVSKERQVLIDTRVISFNTEKEDASLDSGRLVFRQNCSACHAIAGEGGAIGPQLDGVGKWGPRALAEKILDPNRNVSEAFRNYVITLKDGRVLNGLYRRDEGEVIVFADIAGKEFSVARNEIAEQRESKYTLMPDHFGETLSQKDFNALLKYLLSLQDG